jgi:hypothetical protein
MHTKPTSERHSLRAALRIFAGEGARASRVHDSAEFGVLAMTMWRFDPAAGPSAAG